MASHGGKRVAEGGVRLAVPGASGCDLSLHGSEPGGQEGDGGEQARAPADGHTLGLVASSQAINVSTTARLPYNTLRDFTNLTVTATVPLVLVAGSDFPVSDAASLIAMTKRQPGEVSYGSSGPGGAPHLAAALFAQKAGIELTHIPYRGSTQAHPDVITGRVGIMFDTVPAVLPHLHSGKLKALAGTGATRSSLLPEVPTLGANLLPDYEASSWGKLIGPARLPPTVTRRIATDVIAVLQRPEMRERLRQMGAEVVANSLEEADRFVAAEITKWGEVVRAAGILPQ